jgi:hypothetical protein
MYLRLPSPALKIYEPVSNISPSMHMQNHAEQGFDQNSELQPMQQKLA